MNLFFCVSWDKIKERTWSGTCYSLYKALSRIYRFSEISLSHNSLFWKILRKLKLYNDFDINYVIKNRRYVNKKIKNKKHSIVFQFTDIVYDTDSISTFVYQDMSVSYIKYLYYHNPLILKYSGYGNLSLQVIEKRNKMEEEYFKNCSGIFTMGKWYKNFLIQHCNIDSQKVHHVGGGINLEKDKIDYKYKKRNKILFVGRDFTRKGGYLVYEAFLYIKKMGYDYELHIAGPSKNPIPNSQEGYYFHGDCSKDELSELFNMCDIFCMPSYYEAYGLVFIEALTYGLPCIGRNVYEMPFFIENNVTGYLIDDDNIPVLATKIIDLFKNEQIFQNVKDRKNKYIKEYSWDTVAERIQCVINEKLKTTNIDSDCSN